VGTGNAVLGLRHCTCRHNKRFFWTRWAWYIPGAAGRM